MMRHLVLGLLRQGGALHGYALMKRYRDGSGRKISLSTVYRELQGLKARGLVRTVTNPAQPDPRRRLYEITRSGMAAFDAWLRTPCRDVVGAPVDDEHALRAFLVLAIGSPLARGVLGAWRQQLDIGRMTLSRAFQHVDGQARNSGGTPAETLPLWIERQLKHLETDLEFVGHLESAFTRPPAPR